MIVYIPTPITSVEQAEALPIGTVATTADVYQVSRKIEDDGAWQRSDLMDDLGWDEDMVGWTALVPIEAEEETTRAEPFADGTIHVSPQYWRDDPSRRLVTEWITKDPTESAGEKVE